MRLRWDVVFVFALSLGSGFAGGQAVTTQYPRIMSINYDPIIEASANRRLHVVAGWNDPTTLNNGYISDIKTSSHNIVQYQHARWINADVFPLKTDGFRYTDATYEACRATWSGWHSPDSVDYKVIARDYDLARRVDAGMIDEVFVQGAPYFGYYESRMAGRGGYWCNSPQQTRVACSKIFIMMGYNYERWLGEMLEDYGHRTESIMWHTYGSWEAQQTHAWNRFTLYNQQIAGEAGCGNVHFAPNSTADYQWGNTTYVWSYCDDWLNNYPNLIGQKKWVNCTEWGNGDMRAHHMWWFERAPHVAGSLTEYSMTRLNNWWEYMQGFNTHTESGGDHVPGGTPPSATPNDAVPVPITNNIPDDWAPQINNAGRLVWFGWDGVADYEIYSSDANGTNLVQISNNTYLDEDPRINAAGQIVWQTFDGRDFEIFTANADGTGLTQITNNTVDDWHPDINDSGRIVWDRFDGNDYEIFSANIDGTGLTQITNNSATFPTRPPDDVWPKINNAGRVVWYGYDVSGSDWEIFSANSDGTGLVNVSNNTREDEYPQINDSGRVVWMSYQSDTDVEIYSADATGSTPVALTNNSVEDWHPQISNTGRVVWMSRIDTGDWEIYYVQAAGGTVQRLTNNSTHDQYPQVNSFGEIVWQGFDGNDWEIYAWDGTTVSQLTNNTFHDRAPQMNDNGRVTWHVNSVTRPDGSDRTEINSVSLGPCNGDSDGSGTVDLKDYSLFSTCLTGPLGAAPTPACSCFDSDDSGKVDLLDAAAFQDLFTG